jgi:hypothetical protein
MLCRAPFTISRHRRQSSCSDKLQIDGRPAFARQFASNDVNHTPLLDIPELMVPVKQSSPPAR